MGKTFTLTTPPTGGPKYPKDAAAIKAFQRQFKEHGWYTGAIDGIYGTATASAAHQAKFHLGYTKPDHNAGDLLYGYLTGKNKPTAAMKTLAASRKQAANKLTPQQELAKGSLGWYIKNTGMKENPPNSNHCPVTVWYGFDGAWCAMTGCEAYDTSGSKVWTKANSHRWNWAYVPNIQHDAKLNLHGLKAIRMQDAFPGVGLCFTWPGMPGGPHHFGVFEKWINKSAGTFYTREGNTAVGNDSDGGEIMQRQRNISEVSCVVVVTG